METNDVVKELGTKITIPKGIKEAIYDKLFKNLFMAILVLLYFIFVNLGYIKLSPNVFEEDLHVFAGILIILTIVSFEFGYRKSNMELSIHGAELLFLSVVTLFMPYIYFHRGLVLRFVYSFVSIYITVYYLVKCVVIYVNETRKYKNGLSDIKELVDDEEDENYLYEPSERKFKDVEEDEPVKSTLVRMLEKTKKEKTRKVDEEKPKKITARKSAKKTSTKKETKLDDGKKPKKETTKKTTKKASAEKENKVDDDRKPKKETTKKTTKKVSAEKENKADDDKKPKKETVKKTTRKKKEDKEG